MTRASCLRWPRALAHLGFARDRPDDDRGTTAFDAAPADLRFAAGGIELAEILRHSKHGQGARFDDVFGIVNATTNGHADRQELATLVRRTGEGALEVS